ncbi:hypothetical protein S40293_04283 [Stachybotrys chartarum IBT 40293]|nr:hypothetical protein S40293_04283 [Stachybotrys chartarum IBT 40293]
MPARTGNFPGPGRPDQPRILFVDAYDSFTCNITALLHKTLGPDVYVHVVHMDLRSFDPRNPDWSPRHLLRYLRHFDAVICGPGPGSPDNAEDVGIFEDLWSLDEGDMVPVLGICLGFQSLVRSFGGRIKKLQRGLHGMVREIEHRGPNNDDAIFRGVPAFRATLYHSLCADIGQDLHPSDRWDEAKWLPTSAAPDLLPLAWTSEEREQGVERILMAVKHRTKPFWGLQYHPESVCTEQAAHKVIRNWFQHVGQWNLAAGRKRVETCLDFADPLSDCLSNAPSGETARRLSMYERLNLRPKLFGHLERAKDVYYHASIDLPEGVDTVAIAEVLGQGAGEVIMLDSSSARKKDPLAKISVLALDVPDATRIEYRAADGHATLRTRGETTTITACGDGGDRQHFIWMILAAYQQRRAGHLRNLKEPASCKFKGGFMGYLTYEMGLNALSADEVPRREGPTRPDLCMVWVQRSVVVDHQAGKAYVQALEPAATGEAWVDEVAEKLRRSQAWSRPSEITTPLQEPKQGRRAVNRKVQTTTPEAEAYEDSVRQCQDAIAEGNSYELCLTAQTTMTRPRCTSPPKHLQSNPELATETTREQPTPAWDIYKELRSRQPAPFGSFIRLGGATLLSSSPERFLSVNREGLCEMRPMKGTVRKSETVKTLADAERLLHIPKEEAENLMIVDLVRHDLHRICGPGRVTVPELLKVEEYESVFTMITAVNGQVPSYQSGKFESSPFAVLDSVFPPGSMTGAPKKRSCEILRSLETTERSLYSGVVGYFDATGSADWSVTIRSMFRWEDEDWYHEGEAGWFEKWHIGAGGAVTILSTPEGEREEMLTKLAGPLGVFRDTA